MINNPFGYLFSPRNQWQQVASASSGSLWSSLLYTAVMAAIPCAAWYHGTTTAGVGDNLHLSAASARQMIIAFYLTIIGSVIIAGGAIHFLAKAANSNKAAFSRGMAIAAYCATPLFLAGAFGAIPQLWLDLLVGSIVFMWSAYLLYLGIPIAMNLPAERGALYLSALIGICIVVLMLVMGAVVIAWDMGLMPVFSD